MNDVYRRLSITDGGDVAQEDWDRLERLKGLSELMDEVFFWCWTEKTDEGFKPRHAKTAQKRFVAMTALVKPDLIGDMTYAQIGEHVGISKQWMSAMAKDFQSNFGLKFSRSHKNDGKNSAAQSKSWQKRKSK